MQIMEDNIRIETQESWIADAIEEGIDSDEERFYDEEHSDDSWAFFLKGCYCTQHTDIDIFKVGLEE